MKRPAAFRFASVRNLFALIGVTALALVPQIALAQHGGGHAGGGMGGGHASPGAMGGGSPHFSSPPAPHYSPPPAPHVQPATHFVPPPAAYVPPRVPPPVNSVVNNRVVHPTPAPGNVPQTGAGFSGVQPVRPPVTPGFPSADASLAEQLKSETLGAAIVRPGAPLRFVGEGHQIYSEPAGATANSTAASAAEIGSAASVARRPFPGPAGLASATATPGAPLHIFPPHRRVPPVIVNPGFGTFGFGGFGFGTPFFGSPFYFGDPYFFGDPFFGFGYGSVFEPCNGFGAGFQCMPYNSNYGYEQPFTSTMIGGTETETQSQEIFSPYSPALPQPEENTNGPSPDEYVLYLKDGAFYVVNDYWYADGKLVYSTANGQDSIDLDRIDMQKTLDINAKRGLVFTLRPAPQQQPDQAPPDQQQQPNQTAPAPAPQP